MSRFSSTDLLYRPIPKNPLVSLSQSQLAPKTLFAANLSAVEVFSKYIPGFSAPGCPPAMSRCTALLRGACLCTCLLCCSGSPWRAVVPPFTQIVHTLGAGGLYIGPWIFGYPEVVFAAFQWGWSQNLWEARKMERVHPGSTQYITPVNCTCFSHFLKAAE